MTATSESSGAVLVSDDPLQTAPCHLTSKEVCLFLADYAVSLLGCGATCIRLVKNVVRIAEAYGKKAELTIMPRHIHITVWHPHCDDIFTSIASVKNTPISFNLNTRLSELSWDVADNVLTLPEAKQKFHEIINSDKANPWKTLLLASLANASFCGIFGGDLTAMLIVFLATAFGFNLKQMLAARHIDLRVIVFLCAFVSSVIGATCYLFGLGNTPDVAIATSVLYLVPGIPFLNSFSDLLYRHYICAFSRFTDALVLTGCLSLGLCLGMRLMNVAMF